MKISTVLNGKTISQISQEIEEFHEKLPVDEVAVEMAKKAQGTPSMPRYTPKTSKKGHSQFREILPSPKIENQLGSAFLNFSCRATKDAERIEIRKYHLPADSY